MKQKNIFWVLLAIATILVSTTTVYGYYGSQRVSGWQLLDEIIDSRHYVNGSIDNEHVSATCINSSQIVDGTIANVDVAARAINDTQLSANAIMGAVNSLTAVQNVVGTTYVDVINKTVTLNRTSMVIVTYSAETKTTTGDGNLTLIRAQLGGVAMTPNIEARFPNQTYYVASSYMFYNTSVVSGTHNVNISARAINAAETVNAINQSLVVLAVPA